MGFMTIDGQRVEFTNEPNVLTVIRNAEIDIPTLCYHSELSIYGACRLCTVENDRGKTFASCAEPPRDGMVIYTNTPRLMRYRRTILELLLAAHDRDCTTCVKSGECHLLELAHRMGVDRIRFKNREAKYPIDESSPAIVRNPNKCILCGDCVRMCDNVQSVNAIDFAYRGTSTLVTPAFNKTIASNNQIEDLYTVVREGKWTYDKLSSIAETVMQDLNGDGVMTPEEDIYGFLGARDVTESFYYGSGGQMVSKNSDGVFELTFGSERDINVTEKIIDLMNQPWFMNHHLIANQDDNYYRQLFEQGYGLFFWMRLDEVTNMRASDADFGILPIPKYEESQDKYYSMVSRYITGLPSIPITLTGEKLDEVGLVLEALSAESYYTLIPEYIETSLKTKNSRDAESADMLDIIINNRVFDPMHIYNFGGFSSDYLSLGDTADKNIASWLKSKQKLVQKTIDRTVQNIEDTE